MKVFLKIFVESILASAPVRSPGLLLELGHAYQVVRHKPNVGSRVYRLIHFIVSRAELCRLKDAFQHCTGLSGTLALSAFHSDVLGGSVPRSVAEQIYNSISGGKGMTFKDLLCLLVLITNGTKEERIQRKVPVTKSSFGVSDAEKVNRYFQCFSICTPATMALCRTRCSTETPSTKTVIFCLTFDR
jgi:hypothetical protein